MKNSMTLTAQNAKIEEFVGLYTKGVEAWMRAGEIIVELVEADPHVFDYIIQQCPFLNAGVLGQFEKMGRKILHPQLLLTNSPGCQKLSRMPFSIQERYLDEPIPLIVQTESGTDVLLVKAKDLTRDQAKQVFATNRLRTEGEQKALLIEARSNAARSVGSSVSQYTIKNGKAIIGGIEFTGRQLLMIASELTK